MTPVEYLYSLELHGIKLGLENIRRLLDAAGHPESRYPTLHIAGTNGKGSVVAMLDSMLLAAGYRTGRFTSPHLVSVRERFLVNRALIPPEDLDRQIESFRTHAEREGIVPTFFELCTAVAFGHFAEQRVDAGVIEVGLGGRFDSTNLITPALTAITNISLEHTKYLGDTLEKIAFEKAGIIKPGVPLVLGERKPGPAEVIRARARELGAPLRDLGRDFTCTIDGPAHAQRFSFEGFGLKLSGVPLGLPGPYQRDNAALAVAAALELRETFPKLDARAIEAGLAAARWPCRLERVLDAPETLIDVAHNAAGAQELARALDRPCVLVLAVSSDKDAGAILAALGPKAERLILTQFEGPRALPAEALSTKAAAFPHERIDSLHAALERGLEVARDHSCPLAITGSLFTAGQARKYLTDHHGAPAIQF